MSEMRFNGLRPGGEKAEDWHLEQLGEGTVDRLLELDLANKPEAQVPLLQFLAAMGVDHEKLKESKVAQAAADSQAYKELVGKEGLEALFKKIE